MRLLQLLWSLGFPRRSVDEWCAGCLRVLAGLDCKKALGFGVARFRSGGVYLNPKP